MKKIIGLILFLLMIVSLSIGVLAWNAPTVSKYVENDVEFRSVWVCTVSNMDVNKQSGTSDVAIEKWKKEYLDILDNSVRLGMNAIIFQVRPSNDAFYPSKYNPWSEYLVGYGVDPGWDPLEWMIEVTHDAGLEYHAWLNPYRASTHSLDKDIKQRDQATNAAYLYDYDDQEIYDYKQNYFKDLSSKCENNNTVVDNPIFKTGDDLDHSIVLGTEGQFVLNPAEEETVEHLKNTIFELVDNYDIDGIHFDDYFYPDDTSYKGSNPNYKKYTFSFEPDIDYNDYLKYQNNGGDKTIYDWRRNNVDNLIESLSKLIREHNKTDIVNCAFGISPSPRWAPSIESCPVGSPRAAEGGEIGSCNNYYSYSDLFADTRKWVLNDWIDYILPQCYSMLGSSTAGVPTGSYPGLVKWWSDFIRTTHCKLYIGTAAYQINKNVQAGTATTSELFYQQRYCNTKKYNTDGFVMFRYDDLVTDGASKTAMEQVRQYLWKKAALTPTYDFYEYSKVKTNALVKQIKDNADGTYTVCYDKIEDAKAYGIVDDNNNVVMRVLGGMDEITFVGDKNIKYKLITYSKDNSVFDVSSEVDLNKALVNQAPVITFNSKLEKEYLVSSKINLSFSVSDNENDELLYTLSTIQNGSEQKIFNKEKVVDGKIEYNYLCYAVELKGFVFKLVVEDGHNVVEFVSDSFDVVKELTNNNPDPEPDPEPDPDPDPGQDVPDVKPGKKKCGKKSADVVVYLISAVSLFNVILRKKD